MTLQDQMKGQLEDQIRKLKSKVTDSDAKSVLFMIEIDRLHQILMAQEAEIESWNVRHEETLKTHESEHAQLKSGFENLLRSRVVSRIFKN
jgi:ATP-dependent Clp protease ATP-binding subunit ClpA